LRSLWYDGQVDRRTSKQEVAQELDIDYAQAGDPFFDIPALAVIKTRDCRPPADAGEFDWRYDLEKRVLQSNGFKSGVGRKRLKLWRPLDAWGNPPMQEDYVIGCDIAAGDGASNSVASVGSVQSKEKIAEFAGSDISPEDFARYVVALGRWFYRAYLVWEANGAGAIFGKQVFQELGYTYVYWQRDELAGRPKKGTRPGWFSTRTTKMFLLSDYRRMLGRGEFINRCTEAVDEAFGYVYLPGREIGAASTAEWSSGAKATHGDRVIADALCAFGMQEPRGAKRERPFLPGSYAHRQFEARLAEKDAAWKP
jgi:hypothetical protein